MNVHRIFLIQNQLKIHVYTWHARKLRGAVVANALNASFLLARTYGNFNCISGCTYGASMDDRCGQHSPTLLSQRDSE